jgi:hypothetical protein
MSYIDEHYDELVKSLEGVPHDRLRMRIVLSATQDAALHALQISSTFFSKTDDSVFGGPQVRQAWQADFDALIQRLQFYRAEILPIQVDLGIPESAPDPLAKKFWCGLPPEGEGLPDVVDDDESDDEIGGGDGPDLPDIQPGVVCIDPAVLAPISYHGLVERRTLDEADGLGAGVVPDAAMPAHLLEQLDILKQHSAEMDEGWFKGLLGRLAAFAEDVADDLSPEALKATAKKVIIVVAVVVGTGVVVGTIAWLIRNSAKKKQRKNNDR